MINTKKIIVNSLVVLCVSIVAIPNRLGYRGRWEIHADTLQYQSPLIDNPWKRDSCGCLHIRSYRMAKDMLEDYNLLNNTINEFEKYFGTPNFIKTYNTENEKFLGYYYESICDKEKKIIEGADCSWLEFQFVNDTLKGFHSYIN